MLATSCARCCCAPLLSASRCLLPKRPLKIGIVGTGEIGSALATHWARPATSCCSRRAILRAAGSREVARAESSRRDAERSREFGDVILLSVRIQATPDVGRDLANDWKGKIVLDTGNPYPFRDGAMAEDARKRSTGVTSKEYLPGVRLVRARSTRSMRAISPKTPIVRADGGRSRWRAMTPQR